MLRKRVQELSGEDPYPNGIPDFIDESGDYRLRRSSPAIDAGLRLEDVLDGDLGGSARLCGDAPDLGAFERMKRASQTAQFGHLVWAKKYFDEDKTMQGMREILANIKDGSFIRALKEERTKNSRQVDEVWPRLRSAAPER